MDIFSIHHIAGRFNAIALVDIAPRSDVLPELPTTTFLHAGPPLAGAVPQAMRRATLFAILYEGLAGDAAQACHMLDSGAVTLRPAQDFGVVTPLAQVVSASAPLAVVQGANGRRFAPLIEAGVPALRFGNPPDDAAARLRMMELFGLQVLRPALARQPVALAPLVLAALQQGEECHALTSAANARLVESLSLPARDRALLAAYPAFVLPILMAASSAWLQESASPISAVGGNGLQFGWRGRGETAWRTVDAVPPAGVSMEGMQTREALGAIGDSAVIDFAGLGGQALAFSPALAQTYASFLPQDLRAHRAAVLDARTGNASPEAIAASGQSALVNLAILGAPACSGLIGRGVYAAPPSLFTPARRQ
ncbi:DUF1116 domain-containing protein [Corticibacter populi]|nr:DUF1116 domain-containing protein [Corticibacter populi]RZS33765.1 uncharacterized protein DUF1116 [Corticibacter populi]